ncbi:S8 family serine peptidase [Flavobacterium franklandianum]|uniref:S8 family serine peptidase n=1 Tax=Flavobacterium franklandianum TaxID=2594430 RepID=A0A553CNL2_9FLAO|nr:S8 family serine peptidase [Flavobacterium franklandianum]TRX22005.1 S8 family serine peptidase [Flavobacterium franklandianum]TRX28745.1 S8 family serine peptidase [Flavobacterium franklandianum]
MRKIIIFLFLVSSFVGFSQEEAWVYFKDKPDFQTYLDNPITMLSQRALDRRTAQGIALDIIDVPIYQPYINAIINSSGITIKAKSKWLNCLHIRGSVADINALILLSSVLKVDFADKTLNSSTNKTVAKLKFKPVNKTMETAVTYNYGISSNQIQMLNGHLLHQLDYTGSGKIIAVMDSGFPGVDTAQPFQRLRNNNQILGGYDFINKSSNYYSGNNHGTYVLSSMGGYVDGQLVGTAPDAMYYLFITEDAISAFPYSENPVEESNWVEAAEEADRLGVDIISTSLGYFGYDNPNYSHTYSDMTGNLAFASQGANIAFDKGIIVVASAGNEGQQTEPHVGIPAEAKNVIAVGAVQANETYALFSSIGPSYDDRVKPDVMAQGQTVVLSDPAGNLVTGSGTSFSCPITSGMVACLWQALPGKNAQQIKQLIQQSSDNFTEPAVKSRPQYGYGIPDFNLALSNGLSVEEFLNNEYKIYPNPTNDLVSFSLPSNVEGDKIYIYSISGQKVIEENSSTQVPTISLKSLSSGVYFYKIVSKSYTKTGKIIKQ